MIADWSSARTTSAHDSSRTTTRTCTLAGDVAALADLFAVLGVRGDGVEEIVAEVELERLHALRVRDEPLAQLGSALTQLVADLHEAFGVRVVELEACKHLASAVPAGLDSAGAQA